MPIEYAAVARAQTTISKVAHKRTWSTVARRVSTDSGFAHRLFERRDRKSLAFVQIQLVLVQVAQGGMLHTRSVSKLIADSRARLKSS